MAVSEEPTDRMYWFLHTDTSLGKLKVTWIIFFGKHGYLSHGTLKSAVYQE